MSTIRDGYVTAADGLRLYFQQIGSGPRLLVVPNGVPFLDRLAGAAATHTIVAYDPRNRGRSEIVAGPPSKTPLDDEVDDIDAVGHSTSWILVTCQSWTPGSAATSKPSAAPART